MFHRTHRLPCRRSRPFVEELERRDLLSVLSPIQVKHAYGFDQVAADGSGQTIAIVSAFDAPTIAADLKTFDQTFHLPDATLAKVSPAGSTPVANAGWAQETSLDVEWAHAVAPGAKILLVEASSSSLDDLMASVDYARNQPDVSVVSMSWGLPEVFLDPATQQFYDNTFTTPAGHQGVTFVAASGDSGAWFGPEWPSVSSNVLSVGGSTLRIGVGGTYSRETGWSGSGGGISSVEPEPSYQQNVQSTGARTSPDVAYNADPNTGYPVFDSLTKGGWFVAGGTSAGAPQWAGLLAAANEGRALNGLGSLNGAQATLYQLPTSDFHGVTGGGNGYRATPGYNLVTGLGTPHANLLIADLAKFGAPTQTTTTLVVATAVSTTTSNSGTTTTTPSPTAPQTPAKQSGKHATTTIVVLDTAALNSLAASSAALAFSGQSAAAHFVAAPASVAVTASAPLPVPGTVVVQSSAASFNVMQSGGGDTGNLAKGDLLDIDAPRFMQRIPADDAGSPIAPIRPAGGESPENTPKPGQGNSGTKLPEGDAQLPVAGEAAGAAPATTPEQPEASVSPLAMLAGIFLAMGGFWSRERTDEKAHQHR